MVASRSLQERVDQVLVGADVRDSPPPADLRYNQNERPAFEMEDDEFIESGGNRFNVVGLVRFIADRVLSTAEEFVVVLPPRCQGQVVTVRFGCVDGSDHVEDSRGNGCADQLQVGV